MLTVALAALPGSGKWGPRMEALASICDYRAGISLRGYDTRAGNARPPLYFTPDWQCARESVRRFAALSQNS